MEKQEQELESLLMGQQFGINDELQLQNAMVSAQAFALATHGIAVLSDFLTNACYIYSGNFGRVLGLSEVFINADSAFEHVIFDNIPSEELLGRHILELRFFQFLKSVRIEKRTDYYATCLLHFQTREGTVLPVLHSTRYVSCQANGSVRLGLCTYIPFPEIQGVMENCIIDTCTGRTIRPEQYARYDNQLLSKRQLEVLSLLAKGTGSKQIADQLNISVYTVNRHRQDILSRLHVSNTAAAVEIGLRMHLI